MTETSNSISELEHLKGPVTYERLDEINGRFIVTVDVSMNFRCFVI